MLTRIILDGVPSIDLPPGKSLLQALTLAFEAILSDVDGHESVNIISINDFPTGLRRLQLADDPLYLVLRIVARRRCFGMDCSDTTRSSPIVMEYRQALEEAAISGALASAILDQAKIHNIPHLFAVSPRSASSNLISYTIEVQVDDNNNDSAAFAQNFGVLALAHMLTFCVLMIIL
jgi:hypothetical protein